MSYLRKIRGRGFSLFSNGYFDPGDIVLQEPIIVLPGNQWRHIHATALHEYYFGRRGFCFLPLGWICLLAHSHTPNLDWNVNKRKRLITFKAIRYIDFGDELTFDYGWDDYPWEKKEIMAGGLSG